MGFISPSLSEPHPQMKHTVTACWGHNQLLHFLGDSLKSQERAFFSLKSVKMTTHSTSLQSILSVHMSGTVKSNQEAPRMEEAVGRMMRSHLFGI